MDAPDATTDRAEAPGATPAPVPAPASLWAVVADDTVTVAARLAAAPPGPVAASPEPVAAPGPVTPAPAPWAPAPEPALVAAAEPARHHHRHGHGHRHEHRRHRSTPRPAKLAWWHVALVVLVGLLVTYLVVHLAAGQAAPPAG